jgi:hypothetical protein
MGQIWAAGWIGSYERVVNGLGHLHGIAVAFDVHIHDARSFVEQVVMDWGLLDSEFLQLHHYWFNFHAP